ncbi:uncharacterized protein [Penaeus vannamei]|uniref:uncharacterized protein n=1 Tax=Penaeus vannamei TaxID=6689 RepID=UPI00387F7F1C
MSTRNERGQMLVDFAEARSLNIMNTFFIKRLNGSEHGSRHLTSKTKLTIISNRRDIIKNVEDINTVNVGSDLRMVRGEIKLNLRSERNKYTKTQPNLANLKTRPTEFSLNIQNIHFSATKISTMTKLTNSSMTDLYNSNEQPHIEANGNWRRT